MHVNAHRLVNTYFLCSFIIAASADANLCFVWFICCANIILYMKRSYADQERVYLLTSFYFGGCETCRELFIWFYLKGDPYWFMFILYDITHLIRFLFFFFYFSTWNIKEKDLSIFLYMIFFMLLNFKVLSYSNYFSLVNYSFILILFLRSSLIEY